MSSTMVTVEYMNQMLAEQRRLFNIELRNALAQQKAEIDAYWGKILAETEKRIVARFQHAAKEGITSYSQPTAADCCICLEYNSNCKTRCDHDFHINCIYRWIDSESFLCLTCPMCRTFLYE